MSRYLRIRQLASTPAQPGRLPVSPASVYRWVQRGEFPAPVRLSRGVSAWPLEAVEKWEAERAAAAA